MSTASCLYEGSVHHFRATPQRRFTHRISLAYIDLDELPDLLGGRLVSRRPGMIRFRRSDYLGPVDMPLDQAVRDLVERETGQRPGGPVRLLTQLRSGGHCFNPVSFYYCYDLAEGAVEALVAEVTNTPWGERHAYVIPGGGGRFPKALHVSPFMGMNVTYECRSPAPGERLSVRVRHLGEGTPSFEAGLELERREMTRASLRRLTIRYPFATLRILALIYAHAIGLRLAGARVFPHPARSIP